MIIAVCVCVLLNLTYDSFMHISFIFSGEFGIVYKAHFINTQPSTRRDFPLETVAVKTLKG